MADDRKSVSKLARQAALRIGDVPQASKRSIASGNVYHAGRKDSLFYKFRYTVLALIAAAFLLSVLKQGILYKIIAIFCFPFLFYVILYIYWSHRDILTGLPGKVFYDDRNREGKKSYLFDKSTGLHGSPDYIMEHQGRYYVVEYKTRPYGLPGRPNYKHLTQLTAYHVMLEKIYLQKMWDFGYLVYQSRFSNRIRSFRYKIDAFMKNEVLRNL